MNELLDAIRFQFSGETPTQGRGLPRFFDIALLDKPGDFCKTYQDFQAHQASWNKTKGMRVEDADAFAAKNPALHSWMKSKLDPYEHFRHGEVGLYKLNPVDP